MKCTEILIVLAQVSFLMNGYDSFYYRTPIKGTDKFRKPKSHNIGLPYPIPFEEYYGNKELDFLAFADWGEQKPESGQFQVAKALQARANEKTLFIVNAGDNFYQKDNKLPYNDKIDHEGVLSINDPKWHKYWLNVYNGTLKEIFWYMVAGNHDWYTNVTAQVDYFWEKDIRFFFPSLYYSRRVHFGRNNDILAVFIHIDTNPFYYKYDAYSSKDGMKRNLLALKLHDKEHVDNRLKWIEDQLITAQDADWIFVVGHHPLVGACQTEHPSSYLMHKFPPLFEKYNVSAYIGGHVHDIELSEANSTSSVTYFGVGGGGATGDDTCGDATWSAPFTFGFLHINIPHGNILHFNYIEANETDKPSHIVHSGIVHSRKCHEK
ncbi:Metallo-dependent phosphatase [Gigaspora margarita]|uniref:Metallo-dependent phosphatase n=1 Tax=Gigaspora margarita TaxID=4874 RepID=A0A8H4AJ69_GIGMA|nr:Metallo-dependent phosphatase [Gigaspora margarita]